MENDTSTKVGSLKTMAPEMITFNKYDNRVDLWSIGVVYYYMLEGKMPFISDDHYKMVYTILSEEI